MVIFGIETSCDDTAVSVIRVTSRGMESLSHIHFSQIKTHKKYGGVVPEVAAREHTVTIIPTLQAALSKARIKEKNIDLIAVTQGPGLAPALSVGVDTARLLSQIYDIPLVGINHIEGHIASVWPIMGIPKSAKKNPPLPALALVVSGGHSELLLIKKFGSYKLLGKTRDDAAGEAFDKVAALLGLPYPGGPSISRLALKGNRRVFAFPRPMMTHDNFEFSFAGLKTAVRYEIEKTKERTGAFKRNVAASFEQAVIDVLVAKTKKARDAYKPKSILLVGGVSANQLLRVTMQKEFGSALFLAPPILTQDNATMICMAASVASKKGSRTVWRNMRANPSWHIE